MTRLEEHDLKMARWQADNNKRRIDTLLRLINQHIPPKQATALIAEYRAAHKTP